LPGVIGSFDAIRRLGSGFKGAEHATQVKSTLITHQELIQVVLKQAFGAQEPHSRGWDVVGKQLEHPEHPLCVQEAPSNMSTAGHRDAIGKSTEAFSGRLIDRSSKVCVIMQDQDTGSGVPNHLQELLLLGFGVLLNICKGLLNPVPDGHQVRFGHILEKSWAVIDEKAGI
jgi:hypothetical protein